MSTATTRTRKTHRQSPSASERRRHPRQAVVRPCKVFRELTRRYAAAKSCDASDGGVLLEIESSRPIALGERLNVGMAWDGEAMLRDDRLVLGTVVRVREVGPERQRVAVSFVAADSNPA